MKIKARRRKTGQKIIIDCKSNELSEIEYICRELRRRNFYIVKFIN